MARKRYDYGRAEEEREAEAKRRQAKEEAASVKEEAASVKEEAASAKEDLQRALDVILRALTRRSLVAVTYRNLQRIYPVLNGQASITTVKHVEDSLSWTGQESGLLEGAFQRVQAVENVTDELQLAGRIASCSNSASLLALMSARDTGKRLDLLEKSKTLLGLLDVDSHNERLFESASNNLVKKLRAETQILTIADDPSDISLHESFAGQDEMDNMVATAKESFERSLEVSAIINDGVIPPEFVISFFADCGRLVALRATGALDGEQLIGEEMLGPLWPNS